MWSTILPHDEIANTQTQLYDVLIKNINMPHDLFILISNMNLHIVDMQIQLQDYEKEILKKSQIIADMQMQIKEHEKELIKKSQIIADMHNSKITMSNKYKSVCSKIVNHHKRLCSIAIPRNWGHKSVMLSEINRTFCIFFRDIAQ